MKINFQFKILIIFFIYNSSHAQNLQLHYDFGKERNYYTFTFEMFKPDNYGSTYFFSDFDFNQNVNKSLSLAYFEISRYFKIPGFELFQPTIQYNDGTAPWGSLGPVWLAGIQSAIFRKPLLLNFEMLYRNDYFSDSKDLQFTFVWLYKFSPDFSFSGFMDLWTFSREKRELILLSEPQIWYKLAGDFYIGSEVEISRNFVNFGKWAINPTLAIKYNY